MATSPSDSSTLRPPRDEKSTRTQTFLSAILVFVLTATFFVIQYDRSRTLEATLQTLYQLKVAGVLNEGDQYRIGLPFLAHFLEVHAHLAMHQSLPLIEGLSYGLGLVCLYLLLVRSSIFRLSSRLERTAQIAFFFAMVQLPVLWIFPWERIETLPTMLYVAAAALVVVDDEIPLSLACVLTVVLSLMQALNRTDAPLVLGVAGIAASVVCSLRRSRPATALLGALCLATGALMQLYLRHLFPDVHPHQRATTFQLLYNFYPGSPFAPYRIPAFAVALMALFVTLLLIRRSRVQLDPTDQFTLLIALIYLPIYMAFGIISEVRIYVPYLFLVAPMMAKVWMRLAAGEWTGREAETRGVEPRPAPSALH
jgi:hypothetical protein